MPHPVGRRRAFYTFRLLCRFDQHRAYSINKDKSAQQDAHPGGLMKKRISRRQFISTSAATTAVLGAASLEAGQQSGPSPVMSTPNPAPGAWVKWLDEKSTGVAQGVTWGTPWPRGKQREAKNFALRGTDKKLLALQSWPLAYWPDGSLKWTAHALPPQKEARSGPYEVVAQRDAAKVATSLGVKETDGSIEVDTGIFVCRLSRCGVN